MDIVIKEEFEDYSYEYENDNLMISQCESYEKFNNSHALSNGFLSLAIKKEVEDEPNKNTESLLKLPKEISTCSVVITEHDKKTLSDFLQNNALLNVDGTKINQKMHSRLRFKDRRKQVFPKHIQNEEILPKNLKMGSNNDKMQLKCKKCPYRAESESDLRMHINSFHMFMIVKKGSSIYSHNYIEKKLNHKCSEKNFTNNSRVQIKNIISKQEPLEKLNGSSINVKYITKLKSSISNPKHALKASSDGKNEIYKKFSKKKDSENSDRKVLKELKEISNQLKNKNKVESSSSALEYNKSKFMIKNYNKISDRYEKIKSKNSKTELFEMVKKVSSQYKIEIKLNSSDSGIKFTGKNSTKKSDPISKRCKKNIKCGKSSVRKDAITHTCDTCSKRFNRLDKLIKHVNCVHLKIKEYKCDNCDFESVYLSTLKHHILKCHASVNAILSDPDINASDSVVPRLRPKKEIKKPLALDDLEELIGELSESDCDSEVDFAPDPQEKSYDERKYLQCSLCDYCPSRKSGTKYHLKRHIDNVHLKDKRFRCDLCDFRNYSLKNIKKHCVAVHNDKQYITGYSYSHNVACLVDVIKYTNIFGHNFGNSILSCDYCDYKNRRKDKIRYHICRNHCPDLLLYCEHCTYVCIKRSQLTSHVDVVHLNLRPFKCEYDSCEYSAGNKKHLKQHVDMVHLKLNKYLCKFCGCKFFDNYRRDMHIKTVHLKLKSISCPDCDYKTNHRNLFRAHRELVHLNVRKFQCTNCKYYCASKSSLRLHVNAVHLKMKPFQCKKCPHQAATSGNLKKHIDTVHLNKKPFKCDICAYRASLKSALNIHLQSIHINTKMLKCDYETTCDFQTISQQKLKRHINEIHLDKNPFKCNQCNYSAITKGKLKTHFNTVHVEHPFNCEDCEFKSSSLSSLKSHFDMDHNNGDEFQCNVCGFNGKTKQALKLHSVTQYFHSKPFQCCLCDYGTTLKGNLKVHVDSVHKKVKRFQCVECDFGSYLKSGLVIHIRGVHSDKDFRKVLDESIENSKFLINANKNNFEDASKSKIPNEIIATSESIQIDDSPKEHAADTGKELLPEDVQTMLENNNRLEEPLVDSYHLMQPLVPSKVFQNVLSDNNLEKGKASTVNADLITVDAMTIEDNLDVIEKLNEDVETSKENVLDWKRL